MGIQFEIENEIATITLDRVPKRNALSREVIQSINSAINDIANSNARLAVFAAKGPVFCAGMDLGQMRDRAASDNADHEYEIDSQVYCEMLINIVKLSMPTLAILQGPVLAGGVGLVMA